MTEPATRALVVEDDPNIVDLIRSNLAVRGFDTIVSADGLRALRLLETESPDIVLLDLMLPEIDGFELCRQIRERSSVAIIVVSARGGERDKVSALNVGADDYMTKPFSIEELLARINATLRRTRPAGLAPESSPAVITVADLVIDLAQQYEKQVNALQQKVGRYKDETLYWMKLGPTLATIVLGWVALSQLIVVVAMIRIVRAPRRVS